MENWDEIKTAYQVARMGTVSGAADVLGVHHATVIRHIDALESHLGVKLFQRHARGYTPTEAGEDLFRVAQTTDDQFSQLVGRIKGRGADVSGELVVTSLSSVASKMVPILADFQQAHPEVRVRYLTGSRLFRLEYGEAHVAVRAGPAPQQPDNVVQVFAPLVFGLFAAKAYVDRHGMPASVDDFAGHRFVAHDDLTHRAPTFQWLHSVVPKEAVTFRATNEHALERAVVQGAGIGFVALNTAQHHPDLVEVLPPMTDWAARLWLVTHVDLHRTNKVQTFLEFLKARSADWVVDERLMEEA